MNSNLRHNYLAPFSHNTTVTNRQTDEHMRTRTIDALCTSKVVCIRVQFLATNTFLCSMCEQANSLNICTTEKETCTLCPKKASQTFSTVT